MKYKCIKELCIPQYDEDGFHIPNACGYVKPGSIWMEDKTGNVCDGEIHLERVGGTGDFGWIDISKSTLMEAFILQN